MKIGSASHKKEFLDGLKKEYAENIWKNESHLLRLSLELEMIQEEHDKLKSQLDEKGKPAAAEEKKALFVLERTLEHKNKEIATVQATKAQNEYGLTILLPRYESN